MKCDDDTVTPVTEEEILKLSGGGKNSALPTYVVLEIIFYFVNRRLALCLRSSVRAAPVRIKRRSGKNG